MHEDVVSNWFVCWDGRWSINGITDRYSNSEGVLNTQLIDERGGASFPLTLGRDLGDARAFGSVS